MIIKETYIVQKSFKDIIKDICRKSINNLKDSHYVKSSNVFEIINDHSFLLYIRINTNLTKSCEYDISALSCATDSHELITINIYINKTQIPYILNDIIVELKDTLYHEIEHYKQNTCTQTSLIVNNYNVHDYFNIHNLRKSSSEYGKYLLDYKELFAYTKGFYIAAKTKKVNIDTIIYNFFINRKSLFANLKEINNIYNIFISFGKHLLPRAKWSNVIYLI